MIIQLATVATIPSQRKTVAAMARPLCRYVNGGSKLSRAMSAASSESAEIQALPVATITVNAKASAIAHSVTKTALSRHAHRIFLGSHRFGKKRSKKNPAPKIVATATPVKML
jgi:hypothetical protein